MWYRTLFYLFSIVIFIVAVQWKKHQIILRRNQPVISIANEWEKHGIPVETTKVDQGPIFETTVLTAQIGNNGLASAYVAQSIKQKLKLNQNVTIKNDMNLVPGKIVNISAGPLSTTGLYLIESKIIGNQSCQKGDTVKIFASLPIKNKVMRLPASVVQRDQDNFYVWKVEGEKVEKKWVKLGATSQQYYQVVDGLLLEDLSVSPAFSRPL